MKAKKVEDLPYVKGMLKKVNLSDFSYESKAKTDEAVAKTNNGKFNNEQVANVSKNIDFRLSGLKQYINQAADNNFYLKVTADLSNDAIVQGSIKILAENLDIYVPVEKLLPKSSAEMEAEGSNDMQFVIEEQESGYSLSLCGDYNPSDARYYSSIYSTNPTDCHDHGTSCGIYQDREWWNNYAYNYYAELCHNDCADLVSQALSYGGLPEDGTWYATKYTSTRSLTWVNTGYLKNYMTGNDYWRTTTYSSATEGAVMYTASNHVVMIAQNDTITHQYNGHTNDRYRANFSDSPSFVYYKLW
ncbi:MAG: hypothetical protein FIA99_15750 [Ruminiclostridium sp.]|nr:hypothetical protein [Ruminiclostridium sp.]